MPSAACRPDAIHLTTSDAPVEASPAANIPDTDVDMSALTFTFPRASISTPACSRSPSALGLVNPRARSTSSVFIFSVLPDLFIVFRPVAASLTHSISSTSTSLTRPSLSPMKRRVSSNHLRVHPSRWLLEVLSTTGQ